MSNLPEVYPLIVQSLEQVISADGIKTVFSSLANGKAPGADGFTNSMFCHIGNLVAPPLAEMLHEALELGLLPLTLTQADLVFTLKKDKDKCKSESYHPIALLNVDAKILARTLADRLKPLMDSLISHDQAAFIKGCGVGDKLIVLAHILYGRHCPADDEVICTFDIAKVFDTLNWAFI